MNLFSFFRKPPSSKGENKAGFHISLSLLIPSAFTLGAIAYSIWMRSYVLLILFVVFTGLIAWKILRAAWREQSGAEESAAEKSPKQDQASEKASYKKDEKKSGGGFLGGMMKFALGTTIALVLMYPLALLFSIAIPAFENWARDGKSPELAFENLVKGAPRMTFNEASCAEQANHEFDEIIAEFVVKLQEGCKTLIVTPQNRNNKWKWWTITWVHHLPAPDNCAQYQFFGSTGWKGPYCGPEDPPDPGNLPDVKGRMYAEGRGELLFRRVN